MKNCNKLISLLLIVSTILLASCSNLEEILPSLEKDTQDKDLSTILNYEQDNLSINPNGTSTNNGSGLDIDTSAIPIVPIEEELLEIQCDNVDTLFISNRDQALWSAVHSNDPENIRTALLGGANINAQWVTADSPEGTTPLLFAIQSYKFEAVKALLSQGACIHTSDNYRVSPLIQSIKYGITYNHGKDIFDYLLKYDLDIDQKDSNGHDALFTAILAEKSPIDNSLAPLTQHKQYMIEKLIERGADINITSEHGYPDRYGSSELFEPMTSIQVLLKGNNRWFSTTDAVYYETLEYLLNLDTLDINQTDIRDNSLLHILISDRMGGATDSVRDRVYLLINILLERDALLLDLQNEDGDTPLMLASLYHYDTVEALLNSGADSSLLNYYDESTITYAIIKDRLDIIPLLINDAGAQLVQDTDIELASAEALVVLARYGVMLDYAQETNEDLVELLTAAKMFDVDRIKFLIEESGIDPTLVSSQGENIITVGGHESYDIFYSLNYFNYILSIPAVRAIAQPIDMFKTNKKDILQYFIEVRNFDPHIVDSLGRNLLLNLARDASLEATEYLVSLGVDTLHQDTPTTTGGEGHNLFTIIEAGAPVYQTSVLNYLEYIFSLDQSKIPNVNLIKSQNVIDLYTVYTVLDKFEHSFVRYRQVTDLLYDNDAERYSDLR